MDNEKEIPFGAFDSELMRQEIFIPEGFTATIDGNKIILTRIENEDERIRKELIGYIVKEVGLYPGEDRKEHKWLRWLEKQGEHKKFRDSIQVGDEVTRNSDGVIVNLSQLKRVAKKDENQGEQKPTDEDMKEALRTEYEKGRADAFAQMQKEWSEEDESILQGIWDEILANKHDAKECEWKTYDKFLDWLKSIKERCAWKPSSELNEASYQVGIKRVLDNPESYGLTKYNWKPSDEQITVLELASKYERVFTPKQIDILIGLKEQLKKLKG